MPDNLPKHIIQALKRAATGEIVIYRRQDKSRESVVSVAERAPLAALILTLVLAAASPARIWAVIAAALVSLIGISLGWALAGARRVTLERRLRYTWVQVGDRMEEIFTLQNRSLLPILAAEIQDHSDLPGYNTSTVRAVSGNNVEKWSQKATSHRRGVFHLGPTTLRFGDPLGLFEVTCHYSYTREVLVFPPIIHDLSVPLPTGGGQGVTASRQRKLAETPAIGSVRDYRPGDPIRRIHWPLSMRHQALMIKEFDDEKGGDVWLALDLDPDVQAGEGDTSTLEYAIIWTASWAWHLLRQGKGVGLYTRAPEPVIVPPQRGAAHLWHILRALAPLEARADIPLDGLLNEVRPALAHGHSLIIVTPSLAPDWPVRLMTPGLRAAARGVILLDARAFRDEANPAAEDGALSGTRSLLARLGLPVTLVRPRDDLAIRPAAPGTGDWEYVATPWGKVVVRGAPAEVKS